MVLWAVHNGGYDKDTWYWGALLLLATLIIAAIAARARSAALPRAAVIALVAFAAYVGWSYASMAWASVPGWAFDGSNRALLYLIIFALFLVVPWTADRAFAVLLLYAAAIGVLAVAMLVRLASADRLAALVIDGRLAAPTGYFNSTVALFTIEALVATALACRRTLPGAVRGVLLAFACASLQLAVTGQSRGWLFTLPLVLIAAVVISRDRMALGRAVILPVAGTLVPLHALLDLFSGQSGAHLDAAARSAGHRSLECCVAVFVLGTAGAWLARVVAAPQLSSASLRRLGAALAAAAVLLGAAGATVATSGDPLGFLKREWNGFAHQSPATAGASSHFGAVGSGRYDFWRVGLQAFASEPIGGLGQDNFADYYITRRRTSEDPMWTHSLEIRLIVHTGIVGFALFAVFLGAAIAAAGGALRSGSDAVRTAAAVCLLPLVVWTIHGSVDWFWEMPALTAPALGFLGLAARLGAGEAEREARSLPPLLTRAAGGFAAAAAAVALGSAYIAVRDESTASDLGLGAPASALSKLADAASVNPWSPDPTRTAGLIALDTGSYRVAARRFEQTIAREPGGWFAWLGAGMAASALGERATALHDLGVAAAIDTKQPALRQALARAATRHPMTFAEVQAAITPGH
jgi:hypothetical protein